MSATMNPFKGKRDTSATRSPDGRSASVRYHATAVFGYDRFADSPGAAQTIRLDTGGWNTATTFRRMEQGAEYVGVFLRVGTCRGRVYVYTLTHSGAFVAVPFVGSTLTLTMDHRSGAWLPPVPEPSGACDPPRPFRSWREMLPAETDCADHENPRRVGAWVAV